MKSLSVRMKITVWFSVIMILIVAATFASILWVDYAVIQKTIQDNLVETLEDNIDEVEYFSDINGLENDFDADQYISYNHGYLEIDDDFLDKINGITTALYTQNGELLYGENPISLDSAELDFSDRKIQKLDAEGTLYYIFDCRLTGEEIDGLWLRGIVSENQGTEQFSKIVGISSAVLPILLILAVIGGYLISHRALRPVQKIIKAAEQISRGRDLKKRIDLGQQGNDELYQLANVFNNMFGRLEQSFKSEQQFTSDASHELRTPMAVIMAQCEYTLEEERTQEEYEEALDVIQRQGRKMTRLIEDMLCFARIEQNSEKAAKSPLCLTELVEDVCSDMSLLKTNGIVLTWQTEPDINLSGNRMLLTRMITNLISNGYRYGNNNGKIEVTLRKSSNEILLTVKDNGIGIPESELERIFERFYRADHSRSTEGTGLGLAMVKEIAEYHGGSINVESEIGIGSTFNISFPVGHIVE